MSSDQSKEITVRVAPSNIPASMREIDSLTDLFNLLAEDADNASVLEHDIDEDGWPDISEVDQDKIDSITDGFYNEVDPKNPSTITNFASSALADVESLYRRFSQNDLIHSQVSQLDDIVNQGIDFDEASLLERLSPLLEEDDERKPGFWGRLFGEEEREKPSTGDIKSMLVDIEMDLNKQSAQLRGLNLKTDRLIRSIELQKESLERAKDEMTMAEARLFIAYTAGRTMLAEWHSDEVTSLYMGKTPFQSLSDDEKNDTDTEFFIPNTAQDWVDLTFSLNMRLRHFRNVYLKNQNFVDDLPERAALIDQMITKYRSSSMSSSESWQDATGKIRDMIEFVRNEQRLLDLYDRAQKLAQRRANHNGFMQKVERANTTSAHNRGKGPAWPANAYDNIKEQSKALKSEFEEHATAIDAEYIRLCDISDHYREKIGKAPVSRVESLSTSTVAPNKPKGETAQKKWKFF